MSNKLLSLAALLLGSWACNLVTGADDITLASSDDDAATTSSGGGAATTAAATGGGAQVAATASGAGGGAATGTTSGAGAGPTECVYPAGPYGVAQGQVVPPSLSWQGYAPASNTPGTISIQDLFDCDGSRGIDAIIVDTSQFG